MSLSWPFGLSQNRSSSTLYCWVEALPTAIVPEVKDVAIWLWCSDHASLYSAVAPLLSYQADLETQLLEGLQPLVAQWQSAHASNHSPPSFVWLVPAAVDQTMVLAKGLLPEEKLLALQAQLEERWVFQKDAPAIAYQPGNDETTAFEKPLVAALGTRSVAFLTQTAEQLGFSQSRMVWQTPVLWQGLHQVTGNVKRGVWLSRFQFVEMGWMDDTLRLWKCVGHPYPRGEESLETAVASYCQPNPAWVLNQHPDIDTARLLAALTNATPESPSVETTRVLTPQGDTGIHWVQKAVASHPQVLTQWAFKIPTLLGSPSATPKQGLRVTWQSLLGSVSVISLVLVLLTGLTLAWQTQQLAQRRQAISSKQLLLAQAVTRHHRLLNNRIILTLSNGPFTPTKPSTSFAWQGQALRPQPRLRPFSKTKGGHP
ncbi:MAG: hypothetical protein QE263_07180 [Vampirovibrionales bacterium]|nr:hypothetical protein [Vampirovibrionales bacterium]